MKPNKIFYELKTYIILTIIFNATLILIPIFAMRNNSKIDYIIWFVFVILFNIIVLAMFFIMDKIYIYDKGVGIMKGIKKTFISFEDIVSLNTSIYHHGRGNTPIIEIIVKKNKKHSFSYNGYRKKDLVNWLSEIKRQNSKVVFSEGIEKLLH